VKTILSNATAAPLLSKAISIEPMTDENLMNMTVDIEIRLSGLSDDDMNKQSNASFVAPEAYFVEKSLNDVERQYHLSRIAHILSVKDQEIPRDSWEENVEFALTLFYISFFLLILVRWRGSKLLTIVVLAAASTLFIRWFNFE
jgi:hypothetical protein